MGREVPSVADYEKSWSERGITGDKKDVTAKAERQAQTTGTLSPVVNPANDPIRRSLMRFDPTQLEDGRRAWVVTVGPPMPVETNVDTTGSMGGNVDLTAEHLPETYDLMKTVLPGFDLQCAFGYFGDVSDRFPFQRGQFEMTSAKLVEVLANMVPERNGGDHTEDPHYGIFGATYLTDAYIHRIGLKGYHFTVSDAPTRTAFSKDTLIRIFGQDVLRNVVENGRFGIDPQGAIGAEIGEDLIRAAQRRVRSLTLKEVVCDLLQTTHAFYLHVIRYHNMDSDVPYEWLDAYGEQRVIKIPSTEYLPQVQSAIVGLTEGTLDMQSLPEFLEDNDVRGGVAQELIRELRKIPQGAQQRLLRNLPHPLPRAGDIFLNKSDLWPAYTMEEYVRNKAATNNSEHKEDVTWL